MDAENKTKVEEGYWKNHSEAWKSSDLTQHEYCEQQKLSLKSFIYQHNRLLQIAKGNDINFVQAKLNVREGNQSPTMQLILPNGVRLDIGNDINIKLLQSVLGIVGNL